MYDLEAQSQSHGRQTQKGEKNAILDSYIFRANMAAFSAIGFNQTEDPLLQLLILFIQYSQELA